MKLREARARLQIFEDSFEQLENFRRLVQPIQLPYPIEIIIHISKFTVFQQSSNDVESSQRENGTIARFAQTNFEQNFNTGIFDRSGLFINMEFQSIENDQHQSGVSDG